MNNEKGFSLIEFLVVIVLIVLLFAAAFEIFVPVVNRSKIEGANVQSQIEGIVGLELLRRDVIHAGLGLPWTLPSTVTYTEASEDGPDDFNDSTANPPRSLLVGNDFANPAYGLNNSDYLVVKAALVGNPTYDGASYVSNPAADRWTTVRQNGVIRVWNSNEDDLSNSEKVIVLQPSSAEGPMLLTANGAVFSTDFSSPLPAAFSPPAGNNTHWYVYGVDSYSSLRRPFNRADFYISTQDVPRRCAPGTGILVKSVLRQDSDELGDPFPILECVATFQVVLGVDTVTDDGVAEKHCLSNNIAGVSGIPNPITAQSMREQLREIRIYALIQEGEFDRDYNYNNFTSGTSILVGENAPTDCDAAGASTGTQSCDCTGTDAVLGLNFNLNSMSAACTTANFAANCYKKYRWRLHRMVLNPETTVLSSAGG